jgi:hypothetical protein
MDFGHNEDVEESVVEEIDQEIGEEIDGGDCRYDDD